jgi:hypothetical protein
LEPLYFSRQKRKSTLVCASSDQEENPFRDGDVVIFGDILLHRNVRKTAESIRIAAGRLGHARSELARGAGLTPDVIANILLITALLNRAVGRLPTLSQAVRTTKGLDRDFHDLMDAMGVLIAELDHLYRFLPAIQERP